MRVVAFNCSARKDGNTALLLRAVLDELETAGADCELVQMAGERIQGCTACMKCREAKDRRCHGRKDFGNGCIELMDTADGILIGSPVYFADISPEAKALIDRAGYVARGNGDMFARKVGAGVVAVRRAGAIHALDSIGHFFLISQMIVPGSSYWNLGIGGAAGDVSSDEEGMRTMRDLGRNMAWLLERTAG
ncbi:MAG: flavodoxin family protein [Coriobacteriaceae bacterium]|nr:flavodoxin family protein [Coriobacteriaceae bacterium]